VRLESVVVKDTPPVRLFEAQELADVVVIAGPNGAGKTRLIGAIVDNLRSGGVGPHFNARVVATSEVEREAWGKAELELGDPDDAAKLIQTLQINRRRRNWSSSLLNFESDRSIANLQPLTFSWDMVDPEEEQMSWDLTFGTMRDRFQDTVHSMFRMIETQKQSIANRAVRLRREGRSEMRLEFSDPMQPFKDVFSMLLAPKQLADLTARTQALQYLLGDETFDFSTLSSGEREVVNIAFDFLLRRPSDCIVFFDEPELHLHPELSYKLLQTLRTIGERNQFILSTHSPDVITASLDQSVLFLSPEKGDAEEPRNQAIAVSESDQTNQALRMLGQSIGIVALGKRIVLIEGSQSSLDKQTYGSIVGARHPELVLVPAGGRETIESFEHVYESVLAKTIWGVEFFMLCDRDARPIPSPTVDEAVAGSRLAVLGRYHVENYFLDEVVWAEVFATMEPPGSPLRDPAQVRLALREEAAGLISYAAALEASRLLRQRVGNIDAMPKACHGKSLDEVSALILSRSNEEIARIEEVLRPETVEETVKSVYTDLSDALAADEDSWKVNVPGKQLIAKFAGRCKLSPSRAKSLYLVAASKSDEEPFAEIEEIFAKFSQ
jgi:predicted ATPase